MTISIKATRGNPGSGDPTSISGPTVIIKGATNTYTITDYDSFSVYEVTSSAGTVSRTNETITLMVATDEVNNTLQLTVSRDGNIVVKNIAIGAQVIATPNITSPASGSVDVSIPTSLLATAFTSYPTGADTHVSSDWRVKNTAGEIVWQSLSNTVDKTSITIPASNLAPGTQYFAEVRYNGNVLGSSSYSPPVQFTTSVVFIVRPSITSPVSGATGVAATPTFVATAFATNPVGSDTHASSDWRLKDSSSAIIWSSNSDTVNKTSITLPTGVLAVSSQYTVEVRYNGNVLQPSQWSPVVSFTTAAQFEYGKYLTAGRPIYGVDIDTFTRILNNSSSDLTSSAWSPNGVYCAIATSSFPYLLIFKRTGDTITQIASPASGFGSAGTDVSWSPDSGYLALTLQNSYLALFKRVDDVLERLANPISVPSGQGTSVAFSPLGGYLAVGGSATPFLSIYRQTGDSFVNAGVETVPGGVRPTTTVLSLAWSPDQTYLAAGSTNQINSGSPWLRVFKRTGDISFTGLTLPAGVATNGATTSVTFTPDGNRLLANSGNTNSIVNLERSGDTFTKLPDLPDPPSYAPRKIALSGDGLHLAVGMESTPWLALYRLSGKNYAKLANPAQPPTSGVTALSFYPPVKGI